MFHWVVACCSMLQCVSLSCSVLQYVAMLHWVVACCRGKGPAQSSTKRKKIPSSLYVHIDILYMHTYMRIHIGDTKINRKRPCTNSNKWMSHVTHEWVMSHMNESCHTWVKHITRQHVNESYRICANHMSHTTYERTTSVNSCPNSVYVDICIHICTHMCVYI